MYSLTNTQHLTKQTIEMLLRRGQFFVDREYSWKKRTTMVNLFFEPSTRTSLSFQMAAHRLGLTVLDFSIENSSVKKGESLVDTLQTLGAMGVDIAVIRHGQDWPSLLADESLNISLVNAGSGVIEHPTQALLDALTMQQYFGSLQDLTVTIVGDILHSRVARSNVHILQTMGAKLQFAGPNEYKAQELAAIPWVDFDQAVAQSDVVMMLRIQHERHQDTTRVDNYNHRFGLNLDRIKTMRDNGIILHPGPVNRNVEISDQVMQDPRCKILQQVNNGVAIRMAVLEWCLQGGTNEKLATA